MMSMKLSIVVVLTIALSGCSWFKLNDDEDVREPFKLESITKEVDVKQLWSSKVGKGADDKAIRLVPAISGSRIFAAAADGTIKALQLDTGREIWRVQVRDVYSKTEQENAFSKDVDAITGGVGVNDDQLAVGTAAGEIVVLNQSDGSLAWRAHTSSELLAPPQLDAEIAVTHSIDGKISAFNVLDGERLWTYSTDVPSLTLRGTTTPIVTPEYIVAGFASGRVALLNRKTGIAGFDLPIAVAQGRSDLERLVDIDGAMVIVGAKLYVAGYQGSLIAVNLNNAQVEWGHEASSVVGIGEGFGNVYLAGEDSALSAYDAISGKVLWEVDALTYRDITTPVTASSYVVVGDSDGYLHVIAQSDGRFVGRRKVDGKGLYSTAVTNGNLVYILGKSGTLSAFEIR
jgi:outer membrane protein assembly factor BamB